MNAAAASDPDPALLDRLADRGWPALERAELDGWVLRASFGVTNRANSVLAVGMPRNRDLAGAITSVEQWYAERSLPTVFQLSPAAPAALGPALAARGYREHSETDILVTARLPLPSTLSLPGMEVATTPSDAWLDTWWSVDGRGGAAERAIAAGILAGSPALYASVGDPEAPDAVARLALVDSWGGLYAVATRPEARRRGLARALVPALAAAAGQHGVQRLWLQVLADNAPAQALYAGLGFRRASGYRYLTRD